MYIVFDNNKKAENDFWKHPVCESFESAVDYAKEWLGVWSVCFPDKPNQIVDYTGYGDTIEIRDMKKKGEK